MMDNLKIMRTLWIFEWCFSALVAIMFETGMWGEGMLVTDGSVAYILQVVSVMFTIAIIPLCYKLLDFKKVRDDVSINGEKALLKWVVLRTSIWGFAMICDVAIYYITVSSTAGFCTLLVAFLSLLLWPTEKMLGEVDCSKSLENESNDNGNK